jgi:hypothetical protein
VGGECLYWAESERLSYFKEPEDVTRGVSVEIVIVSFGRLLKLGLVASKLERGVLFGH